MTEFCERSPGEAPEYGENGADVVKAKALVLRMLRAPSQQQAIRRLRRFLSVVVADDLVEAAFLAVQECRDLKIVSRLEAMYLLDTLYWAGRRNYSRGPVGRRSAKEAFMRARGEDNAAKLLVWRPTMYEWSCASGAILLIENRLVPEVWGDEKPDPVAVSAISEHVATFAASETARDRHAARKAVELDMGRYPAIDAVVAMQGMREVGMITFAQSIAFMFLALRRYVQRAVVTDRRSSEWFLERRDLDGSRSQRRTELLTAAVFRRVGEHRAANMLREQSGELELLIESARADIGTAADADVEPEGRDVPVVGQLQSMAVQVAKNDIIRALDAPSAAEAERHLQRLSNRVALVESAARAAVTAIQELNDIDLISMAESRYLLDRVARSSVATAGADRGNDEEERARAAEFLDSCGELSIASELREQHPMHHFVCNAGREALVESRPTPDHHLEGVADPSAAALISEKLAAWAAVDCGESEEHECVGPEWEAVASAAAGHSVASAMVAARGLIEIGALSRADSYDAIKELLEPSVVRALETDRIMSRSAHLLALVDMSADPTDGDWMADRDEARELLLEEIAARRERVQAAAYRRFGDHIAADVNVYDVARRGF